MPYLSSFELEFDNNVVIFKISTLEFVKLKNLKEKTKNV